MNTLTLMIALAMIAGAFVVTYVASRICFAVKKAENMLWAAMLCVCGLFYPTVFAGVYADSSMAPSVVPSCGRVHVAGFSRRSHSCPAQVEVTPVSI